MKKHLLTLLSLVLCTTLMGQTSYKKDTALNYYADNEIGNDAYKRSICVLDVYYPENLKDFPTIIWFHGGGLSGGNRDIPSELLNKGVSVISVGYRLSPRAKCPAYIEDAAAAVAWTFNNIARFGGNPNKIYLSGHSAGGYLDMMVGMDKKWLAKYGIDANRIAALIPLSGQAITHFTIRKEQNISDKQPIIDSYAPLYHIRKDLPPLYLITGDRNLELLGRYEENAYLWRMMKEVGHNSTYIYELEGYNHGDMVAPGALLLIKKVREHENIN